MFFRVCVVIASILVVGASNGYFEFKYSCMVRGNISWQNCGACCVLENLESCRVCNWLRHVLNICKAPCFGLLDLSTFWWESILWHLSGIVLACTLGSILSLGLLYLLW